MAGGDGATMQPVGPTDDITGLVKDLARQEGFRLVGVASAEAVKGQSEYRAWIQAGYSAGMDYLARDAENRFHPAALVEDAASVICLAVGYAPGEEPKLLPGGPAMPFVARYARGRDYHRALASRCKALMARIRAAAPGFEGKAFVDSSGLAERSLAAQAGLGWIGRNGCLVSPVLGSYTVLAEIVCNLPLRPDRPMPPACGNCRMCVDACPTRAILENGLVDCRRCLSYLTIEHRGEIDEGLRPAWGLRVFGCDTCQEVCPFNRTVPAGDAELTGRTRPEEGKPRPLQRTPLAEMLAWSQVQWSAATAGSATRRAKYQMLLRNGIIAAGCGGDAGLVGPLERISRGRGPLGELADWSLKRLA